MPGFIARELCPNLIIIDLNYDKYVQINRLFIKLFREYDPNVVSLGLDEACLDITEHLKQRIYYSQDQRTYATETSCGFDEFISRAQMIDNVSQMQRSSSS